MFRPRFNLAFALQERFAFWRGLNPGHVERYNSNMEQFIQDDGKMRGSAYGRYLRHLPHDQIARVVDMLSENPETRRAVMNIHNAVFEDYDCNDVACTIYLHPMLRDGELWMFANLRSQDMLFGYPYDTQAFQWIQEVLAGILGVDVGEFVYHINSMHYYTDREEQVVESVDQSSVYEEPDCRLEPAEFGLAIEFLADGLEVARRGRLPLEELEQLYELSDYYASWLALMTAYEQYRFHDDEQAAADFTDEIAVSPWQQWMEEKL